MNTPNDRVTLTSEEQRALASLEERTRRDDPKLRAWVSNRRPYARIRSGRASAIAESLCFVAGMASMLVTFVQWPAVAVAGIAVQVISLRALLTRWGPSAGARLRRWIETAAKPSP